ncbi:MAG: DUF58 domain-containing protein [Oscillospiraceae bacterium]|jgi:uncharacterized protein (DUF58 family)|nr:DUF58 domain-containing protein [Oscillospiraceae bacterium]
MWKARATYAYVTLIAIVLIFVYEDRNVSFTIFYCLVFLFLSSLTSALTARLFIRVEQDVERGTALRDEEIAFSATLRNKGILYYPRVRLNYRNAALVTYGGNETSVMALRPRGAVKRSRMVRFPYRGYYDIGVESISVTDFLGLFTVTIPVTATTPVCVYPLYDDSLDVPIQPDAADGAARSDFSGDAYTDIADVRQYMPSDTLRNIHWKLSAKRGELIVKDYEARERSRAVVLLDTMRLPLNGRERALFEDRMVSRAASVIYFCSRNNLPAALIWGEGPERVLALRPEEGLEKPFALLAGLAFEDASSRVASLEPIPACHTLCALLSHIDAGIAGRLAALTPMCALTVDFFYSRAMPLTAQKTALLEDLRARGAVVTLLDVGQSALTPQIRRAFKSAAL